MGQHLQGIPSCENEMQVANGILPIGAWPEEQKQEDVT